MCNHTALPVTQHKWTHLALTPARQAGTGYIRTRRDGRLSWPRWLVTHRDGLPTYRRSPTRQCMAGSWTHNLLITSPTPQPLHNQATLFYSLYIYTVVCGIVNGRVCTVDRKTAQWAVYWDGWGVKLVVNDTAPDNCYGSCLYSGPQCIITVHAVA